MIEVKRLHDHFAAEVTGLDLTRPIDDEAFAEVEATFREHSVLIFPNQPLNDDQQIAFSERFGPLEVTKVGTAGAGSKLIILSNIGPDGEVVALGDRALLNNKANQHWHADSSFKVNPAHASLLSGRVIPAEGGNTEYISMRAVYAELSDEMKQKIEGLVVIHDFAYGRAKIAPHLVTDEERKAVPPVRQAMVLDHGAHGKSLYLGAHAASVEGLSEREGRALIDELMAFASLEKFIYSHKWRQDDVILWDNRAVVHRATPFPNQEQRRRVVRTTIAGKGPTLN